VTLDGYFIRINDRIVYTDQFQGNSSPTAPPVDQEIYRLLSQANASTAVFFANAINTETKGIDLVVSYGTKLGNGNFRADLAATHNQTNKVGPVMASELLKGKENIYFSEASRIYLESAVPRDKGNLTLTYNIKNLGFFVRNVYFGPVDEPTNVPAQEQTFKGRVLTDVSISYKLTKELRLTVGSNNVLDIYPDKYTNPANTSSSQFIYSRATTQFGYNGRYVFGRLELNL
jgi:iron complex outermembrane receptor protein